MQFNRQLQHIGCAVLCCLLTACLGGGRPNPADIRPTYQVRNSPIPVPDPRWNPRRNYGVVVRAKPTAPTRSRTSQVQQRTVGASSGTGISGGRQITVKRGETLYGLSRKHGIPLRSLIRSNSLKAPYTLSVGQKLRLPSALTHTVKRGETGYSISRQYEVNLAELMRQNKVKKPYILSVGQRLTLPGGASLTPASRAPVRQTASLSRNATPTARQTPRSVPEPAARSADGFRWPVEGRIASRFGPKEGGLHNDGINIIATRGAPVRSAESGVVVYASNALEGYGNLLLLKHADGWLTAYAHNERLLVNEGDSIQKGQIIARVGDTGGVTEPQLHFEIRRGRRALDPLNYLSNTTQSR